MESGVEGKGGKTESEGKAGEVFQVIKVVHWGWGFADSARKWRRGGRSAGDRMLAEGIEDEGHREERFGVWGPAQQNGGSEKEEPFGEESSGYRRGTAVREGMELRKEGGSVLNKEEESSVRVRR